MGIDSAGRLGTHKGLHRDASIRAMLNQLTALEARGYTIKTHPSRKVEVSYPGGGSVDLVYSRSVGEWVAIERDEWGIEGEHA